MKLGTAMLATMSVLASASTEAETIVITRSGSRPTYPGPAENFTGGVRVERLFDGVDASGASGASRTTDGRRRRFG
jgi:hypothetical protein